ncbi:MAG: branched-chain amino acid ABC transporter permease [Deltaproteobacteria bacterium HGW-Deltaproteobacteria-21]|jgi:branched-chain amino acid transport system permease protein|nr:MAG: branched-chain amino acid ABC transporter permease [Deltaproteobacteria bacterium HGW-Deltaproteobacteria-21]PKN63089.1 MAG: branched-chain amino acid ABC transporter permease [Deltaproteobacteria bacterium HGW-Deltaproteobacteria-15]
MLLQQLANAIAVGSVYALISLGLTMVYGILRILHVAHAGIYTLGAYVGLASFHLIGNLWTSLAAGMAGAAIAGYLVERFLYMPLLHLPRIAPLIVSIGLFTAMEETFRIAAGPHTLAFNAPIGPWGVSVGAFRLTGTQVLILAVTFVILIVFWLFLTRTRAGLAMRACSQDAETASAFGVNVGAIIAMNFLIGSAMAGAAGVLIGVYDNQVWPTMGSIPAYKALAIVVLGGLGSITGTVLASFVVGLAETFFIGILAVPFPRDAVAFLAMILVLMFRPYGLLGKA